jgi:hypothetical protein
MSSVIKTGAVITGLMTLVLAVGLAFTGLPAPAKELPTGLGKGPSHGHDVLSGRPGVWARENTTAGKPVLIRHTDSVEVTYTGEHGDTGLHRKIEVFRGIYHGIAPGQRWIFSIRLQVIVIESYAIVGMEWFKPDGKWAGEKDVYPPVTGTAQRVTVSAVMPTTAKYLAVYVQLPEINPSTRIDLTASAVTLLRTHMQRLAGWTLKAYTVNVFHPAISRAYLDLPPRTWTGSPYVLHKTLAVCKDDALRVAEGYNTW